jgi:hypothetical protein
MSGTTGTLQNLAQLYTAFADGQPPGSITPQDMRNLLASIASIAGTFDTAVVNNLGQITSQVVLNGAISSAIFAQLAGAPGCFVTVPALDLGSNTAVTIYFYCQNNSIGNGALNWPSNVSYYGPAPQPAPYANSLTCFELSSVDGGNNWVLTAYTGQSITEAQSGQFNFCLDKSTQPNILVLNLIPALAKLSDGVVIRFVPANSNTGSVIASINSFPYVVSIQGGSPLFGGELVAGYVYEAVLYTGTLFILGSSAGALPIGRAQVLTHAVRQDQLLDASQSPVFLQTTSLLPALFPNKLSQSFEVPAGYNAVSYGPITIAPSVTVTLAPGATWRIQ